MAPQIKYLPLFDQSKGIVRMQNVEIEEVFSVLGLFGNFQLFIVVMYTIGERVTAGLLDFQVHILSVVPEWECVDTSYNSHCSYITNNGLNTTSHELCQLNETEWRWSGGRDNLVTQFDLICGNIYKISLGSTLFFTGYPIGSLLSGLIGDTWGRKWLASVFLVLIGVLNCFSALLSDYNFFITIRALEGFCIGGLTVSFYPLVIEFVGAKARNLANVVAQCGYGLGMAFLCFVAFYIDSWRAVIIATSSHLFLIALMVAAWVPESPRWLLRNGRIEEAKKVLKTVAVWNRKQLPDDLAFKEQDDGVDQSERVWKLFYYSKYTCCATFIQVFIWFTAALYFFALSFNMNDVVGNPYTNLAATGVMEIIINILSYFVIDRAGRKPCLVGSFVACGVAVGICRFLPHHTAYPSIFNVKTIMVIIGRAFGGFIYSLVYLYSAEIFPTTVRSSGLGLCVFSAQISSLVAPFVIVINQYNAELVYTVLFMFCIAACLLALYLPETMDSGLPQTIADMHNMRAFNKGKTNEHRRLIETS